MGPFPFPGLSELRQKHLSLLSQDTPYKSFFLAKRELDNLKKHYAAIKHRQKATTIILKGLEASRNRSNSLFITSARPTTCNGAGAKGLRRGSVQPPTPSKGTLTLNHNNNKNSNNAFANNLNSRQQNVRNGNSHVGSRGLVVAGGKGKQVN